MYTLQLQAKVNSAPDDIYDILTDPNTVSIFRSIKECTYRRVLEDDGKGKRKLEIGHRAIARFLFLSVSFDTHLYVDEDDRKRTIHFRTAREGLMKKFDGSWHVQPFNQDTLDTWFHPERQPQPQPPNPFSALQFWHVQQPAAKESLVTLEQSLLPRGPTPPGVKGLVRALCAAQIRNMMEDLNMELERRRNGTSTTVAGRQQAKPQATAAAATGGAGAAAKAACMTLAQRAAPRPTLWGEAMPFNIAIQL